MHSLLKQMYYCSTACYNFLYFVEKSDLKKTAVLFTKARIHALYCTRTYVNLNCDLSLR